MKSFAAAKARLSPLLRPDQRAALARWMAARVLGAAGEGTAFVACDDAEVADWAHRHGAQVLELAGLGLNGAVGRGVQMIAERGFSEVIIAHGDLPVARDLAAVTATSAGGITIVPDQRNDGTNVMRMPTALDMPFAYGAGSFVRHVAAAIDLGCPVTVRRDPLLSIDIDTPSDLTHPLLHGALPTWLQTILANHR